MYYVVRNKTLFYLTDFILFEMNSFRTDQEYTLKVRIILDIILAVLKKRHTLVEFV